MKRFHEAALGLSTMFGINHIDNENATQIISYCDAQSKQALHCVSHKFNQLSSYNNLSNILDHNQDTLTQKEKEYALLWATQRNHYNSIKRLLESGADPNADNRLHLSPLTIAEEKKDTKTIELLKQHNCTINPKYKTVPSFVIAIYTRDISTLQQCIDLGTYNPNYYLPCPDNNCKSHCGNILHLAAYIGDANILTILLAQPKIAAKINEKNHEELTPYWIAEKRKYIPFLETLVAHPNIDINIKDNGEKSPIHKAASKGHTNLVKLLTSHKNYQPDTIDASNTTPLYSAVQKNHIEITKIFLDDPRINVNYLYEEKYTPLHNASYYGNTRMVKLLLTHPYIKTELAGNITPLYVACQNGHFDCVKILCLANSNMINTHSKIYYPIDIAIQKKHLEIVNHLLSYKNLKLTYDNGDTLFGSCCVFNYPEAATLFLKHRPEVLNMCDEDTGNSPLHLAAKEGHNAVVKILLETNGCNVNALNKKNKTPLDMAENDETKELIIAHGGKHGKDVQEQKL